MVSLLYLHHIFFAFKINQIFQYFFCFPYKSLQNRENSNFRVLPASGLPTLHTLLLAIYNVELRFVPLSFPCTSICSVHSGAFVAYSGVTPVSFLFVAVSFQLVPVYSGTILVHSVLFRRHSGSFRYIPIPFLSIPLHSGVILPRSGIFRLIPVYSVPFLCLVTPCKGGHLEQK